MRYFIIFLLLSVTLSLFCSNPIAVISGMKGEISIIRGEEQLTAKTGDLLFDADEIVSGIESFASIRFVDNGATAKLFPNSILIVQGYVVDGKLSKKSSVEKGRFLSKVNINSGQYMVETPNTVASVKGTEFLVGYDNFMTNVIVRSGEVDIENKITGDTVTATSDQGYSIDENGQQEELSIDDIEEIDDDFGNEEVQESFIERKTFEVEIRDAAGNIKKVRITYEQD